MSDYRRSRPVAEESPRSADRSALDPSSLGIGLADFYGPVASESLPATMRTLLRRMDASESRARPGGSTVDDAPDDR